VTKISYATAKDAVVLTVHFGFEVMHPPGIQCPRLSTEAVA